MPLAREQVTPGADVIQLAESEKALIAMSIQGDQAAFRKLYHMHTGKVYALCLRLTGSVHQAEEATQEVFITLWKKLASFKGNSSFSTWLHSLSRNTAISYMRRQKSWQENLQQDDEDGSHISQWPAQASTDTSILDVLIPRLPAQARTVFVLHAIEGLRHEEIADTLKISMATSKVHFHRARTLLTQWLEEHV